MPTITEMNTWGIGELVLFCKANSLSVVIADGQIIACEK